MAERTEELVNAEIKIQSRRIIVKRAGALAKPRHRLHVQLPDGRFHRSVAAAQDAMQLSNNAALRGTKEHL